MNRLGDTHGRKPVFLSGLSANVDQVSSVRKSGSIALLYLQSVLLALRHISAQPSDKWGGSVELSIFREEADGPAEVE